jgi:hypothetical protein
VPTQTQQKAFTEHLSHPINPFECSSHAKTIILKQKRPQPQKNTHLRSLNPFTILSSYSSPVKPERIHIRLTKKKICSYDFSPRLVGGLSDENIYYEKHFLINKGKRSRKKKISSLSLQLFVNKCHKALYD